MFNVGIILKQTSRPSDSTDRFCINSSTPGSDLSVIVSTLVAAKDSGRGVLLRLARSGQSTEMV